MKICIWCGKEYVENYSNQQVCECCYRSLTTSSCPDGVITNLNQREVEIKKEWSKHAEKKNERIVGTGYAERQVADTLSRAGKVNTEL